MEKTIAQPLIRGGAFLVKETELDTVFTPEETNEEQEMIRQMTREFVNNESKVRGHLLEAQVELMEKAGELGLLGAHIPEQYGGMGLDTNTNTIIGEEIGKGGGSFNTTFAAHTGIGMLPILYFGTEEQKQKYLPRLASGEWKASYCLTEPGSGSDALSAKTRADLSEDGDHYKINGQKMWISNAGFADLMIVFAQVGGNQFTGFLVEAKTPGISLGAEEKKMGIKGSSTRQVFFENVLVPVANVLGEIGKGHLIAFNTLNVGRFKLGNMAMGGAKQAVTVSVQYANERVQFKHPISYFGAIQHKLAQQAIQVFALESAIYRVSNLLQQQKDHLLDQGESIEQSMLKAAEEYAIECACIKVAGSEYLDFVVDESVQIHGGYGYSEEYAPAMAYRDQRINRIYEGTNEINRMLMVNMLMKRAMNGAIDMVGPAWEVQKELTRMPGMQKPEGKFGLEQKALGDYKKLALMVLGAAAKQQMDGQLDLKNEQEILMNGADLLIDIFMAESLLLRLQKLDITDRYKLPEVYDAILQVFFYDLNARLAKNASDALCSFASGDLLKTFLLGVKRFTAYPPVNIKEQRRIIAGHLIKENKYSL
ncbi:MAG: acyl-CoA dehydrogenase family protein [Saprospiraceae bacterium]|nr:acyl-CoA dehydrogenase family protein [Saprospiraceae bacterium]